MVAAGGVESAALLHQGSIALGEIDLTGIDSFGWPLTLSPAPSHWLPPWSSLHNFPPYFLSRSPSWGAGFF